MKILIVEDEKIASEFLERMLLDHFADCEIVGKARSIKETKEAYYNLKPDLLIMDINLGNHLSFELFDHIDPKELNVVFTTGYQEFALKAFKVHAIDYIMKPVNLADLRSAIDKSRERLSLRNGDLTKQVNPKTLNKQFEVLLVWENEKLRSLSMDDIVKIRSDRNYSSIFLVNGKEILTSKNLGTYEDMLSEKGFFRIHKSCLINIHHFISYRPGVVAMVELTNNQFETISRRKKEELMEFLNQNKK
jgi:two-component system LytT family response regulator